MTPEQRRDELDAELRQHAETRAARTEARIADLVAMVDAGTPIPDALKALDWSPRAAETALRSRGIHLELSRALGREVYARKARRQGREYQRRAPEGLQRPSYCGSERGYQSHRWAGETPCDLCAVAHGAYNTGRRSVKPLPPVVRTVLPEEFEATVRRRIATLSTVKSWEARARASELRALLAQITKKEAA